MSANRYGAWHLLKSMVSEVLRSTKRLSNMKDMLQLESMSKKEKSTIEQTPEGGITIKHLEGTKLVSLTEDLVKAVTDKESIRVQVNSNEPKEILKGTYVAKTISKSGYACRVKFDKNEIEWICDPSNE